MIKFVAVSGDLTGREINISMKEYRDYLDFNTALIEYCRVCDIAVKRDGLTSAEKIAAMYDTAESKLQTQYNKMVEKYNFNKYFKRTSWTFEYPEDFADQIVQINVQCLIDQGFTF